MCSVSSFAMGEEKDSAKPTFFFPIAKLATRYINRGPREDFCEAGKILHSLFSSHSIEKSLGNLVPDGSFNGSLFTPIFLTKA